MGLDPAHIVRFKTQNPLAVRQHIHRGLPPQMTTLQQHRTAITVPQLRRRRLQLAR